MRSPHFIVDCNSGKAAAKDAALQFERIRNALGRLLPEDRNSDQPPLTILAVGNEESLKRLLPGYYKKRGEMHPAGIFVGGPTGAFIVLRTDLEAPGVFEPVYHEYTHYLMSKWIPGMPLWMTEGLADFFSDTRFQGPVVVAGAPDMDNLAVLRSKALLPIKTLLTIDSSSPYYNREDKVDIFYAESWALADYLLIQDARHGTQRLNQYAAEVSDGQDEVAAFTKLFGPPEEVDKALTHYVLQVAFYDMKFRSPDNLSSKTFSVRLLSPAEADTDQAEFLLLTGRNKEATPLLEDALKDDPSLGKTDALESQLYFNTGYRKEAEDWAQKAIRLDPKGYLGYLNAGLAMDTGHQNPADLAAVEQNLEQAVALRPGLVEAELTLADLYLQSSDKVNRGLALAVDAVKREPENMGVLITLETTLLKLGRLADAVRVELRMLDLAHSPKEKAMVRNNIGWALLEQNVAMQRADFEIHEAVRLDPAAYDLDSLGYLLTKEGKLPDAADAFKKALSLRPKSASSLDGLGDVLRQQHDLSGASEEYRSAITLNSRDARAHHGLALVLEEQGDTAGAAKEAEAARSIDPFNTAYQ